MNYFAAAALLTVGLIAGGCSAASGLTTGQEAPDFSLQASDGKTYTLSQFRGKQAVVIAWFPKAFTSGCTKECKFMKESQPVIGAYDVAYFAASVDEVKTNSEFAKSLELNFPILSDPTTKTAKDYGVFNGAVANRWTYYISKEGKILLIDKAVNPTDAGLDLKNFMERLGIPKK